MASGPVLIYILEISRHTREYQDAFGHAIADDSLRGTANVHVRRFGSIAVDVVRPEATHVRMDVDETMDVASPADTVLDEEESGEAPEANNAGQSSSEAASCNDAGRGMSFSQRIASLPHIISRFGFIHINLPAYSQSSGTKTVSDSQICGAPQPRLKRVRHNQHLQSLPAADSLPSEDSLDLPISAASVTTQAPTAESLSLPHVDELNLNSQGSNANSSL